MSRLIPRQIGAVRVGELLGEGGMAQVFQAVDTLRPDLQLAVKFLRAEALGDRDTLQRFLREGEVLKSLRHPHLVEVHGFGMVGSVPYLLMELLPGGSLKACWGEPPARLVRRLGPVADALAFVHAHGVIHRDLKPSNLLFAGDGALKATDFGVCLWEDASAERMTRSRMVVGTLGYMAPEQHGDPRRVDGRCDVFALAAILYEFTTGQPWSQVQLPPAAVRPGFPPRFARLLLDGLAADPARRTPSMAAMRDGMADWLEGAEAAGWGEVALPGFEPGVQEAATQARRREPEDAETRLGPYLDALGSGGVGARRAAAEGLLRGGRPEDESFLLEALARVPEAGRFAVAGALGRVGGSPSLDALLALLTDPYAQREAAEAASAIARRSGHGEAVLAALGREGLGPTWHWLPRARLGDGSWVDALLQAWPGLIAPQRLQALEAARELPEALRLSLRNALAPDIAARGGNLNAAWELL